jgi:hypothetical protein
MGFGVGFLESFVKLRTAFDNYHNNRECTCSAGEVSTYVRARTYVHISLVHMQAHY